MYLEKIKTNSDIKKLSVKELNTLAEEIRQALFNRLSKKGGHFGSNFGVVEMTIALHYIFDSPKDKFVFDVSHQCYVHKMLTGRQNAYINDKDFDKVSGYTNPDESEHDFFNIGHTSTSISLASGLAKARDLKGGKENIIAIIGDGSLSGGEALEGLNFVGGELNSNFIIIVNDNQQSIAEVHGGLYKNLDELRSTHGKSKNNLFKSFNLDYIYEDNGNDVDKLIKLFKNIKDIDHPIVVHINTKKGKGYEIAENDKEKWHWCMPFDIKSGKEKIDFDNAESYTSITGDYLIDKVKKDKSVVIITPAMPSTIGFDLKRRKEAGNQYIDVGIAEEHSVALISGIAKGKCKPVLGTNSTFMQRAYDQVSHDLCINGNPATILLNFSSLIGLNDISHLGFFAISIFSHIPNLLLLAPTNKAEYLSMLDWSIEQDKQPVMILMPCGDVVDDERKPFSDFSEQKSKVEKSGEKIAIYALGDFYQIGEKLSKEIENKLHIKPTLVNPIFASGLDTKLLETLRTNHDIFVTIEDGIIDGGFGANIASFFGSSSIKVLNYGLKKEFIDRYDYHTVMKDNKLTPELIVKDIESILESDF